MILLVRQGQAGGVAPAGWVAAGGVIARPWPDPMTRIVSWRQHVSSATAAGQRDRSVRRRSQAGTLAITANCAPSGSSATANLPTPGISLAGTTTVPPFAVTAAAAASQSVTSK